MALYDPHTFPSEVPTPITVLDFTVADVLAWARSKPADESYDYAASTNCAVCQFLRETGRALKPLVYFNDWEELRGTRVRKFDDRIHRASIGTAPYDWTFGALAKRLQALSA